MGRIAGEEVAQAERQLAHHALGGLDGRHFGCSNGNGHQLIGRKPDGRTIERSMPIVVSLLPLACPIEKFVMLRDPSIPRRKALNPIGCGRSFSAAVQKSGCERLAQSNLSPPSISRQGCPRTSVSFQEASCEKNYHFHRLSPRVLDRAIVIHSASWPIITTAGRKRRTRS